MKRIWVCAAYAIAALIAVGVTLKQILMPYRVCLVIFLGVTYLTLLLNDGVRGQGKFHLCQGLFDDRNTKENRDARIIKRIVFYTKLEWEMDRHVLYEYLYVHLHTFF